MEHIRIIHKSYRYLLFVSLITLGLLGNYFKFSLFLNVDFIFGSIFALLALQFFGTWPGILAGALISLMTYFLWNHPYAIIIMTAEVALVAFLMKKKKMGPVIADVIYWVFLGMPLIYVFYHLVMKVQSDNLSIFVIKQAINGIANALVARLLFSVCILRTRRSVISYKDIIYNLLGFFVIFPSLIILSLSARSDFDRIDHEIKRDLSRENERLHELLKNWIYNRQSSITGLAEMARTRTPKQMQIHLEQAVRADRNFFRIGLHDSNTVVVAHFPLLDEFGNSTLGKSFADRPYIPIIKKELRPFLTDVVKSRIGRPLPVVTTLTPIVKEGKFNGYVIGVLNLSQVKENLYKASVENTMLYALLDRNDKVILTNMADQRPLEIFKRDRGHLSSLNFRGLNQWIPDLPRNTPLSEKWKKSYYVATSSVGEAGDGNWSFSNPLPLFKKNSMTAILIKCLYCF